jgi:ABC-2 type transport system ATP-binding protein
MGTTSGVTLNGVCKSFRGDEVLHDITTDFPAGRIHGVVGNNGSGKTVLFKCICGFLIPEKGEVVVDGLRIGSDVDFPPSVGALIESPGFLPRASGLTNLRLLASLRARISDDDIRAAMERVGLDGGMKKIVGHYSLGMKQRLGIAQATMENPNLLILDEPFNGLDKRGVSEMRDLIASMRGSERTIILASHNSVDIDTLCDTVSEMDAGRIVAI